MSSRAGSDSPSLRSALIVVGGTAVGIVALATLITELNLRLRHVSPRPGLVRVTEAVAERLAYVRVIPIAGKFDQFLSPCSPPSG